MTPAEIQHLSASELDARIIEALGKMPIRNAGGKAHYLNTPYSSDLNAAHELEEEINRRHLLGVYVVELVDRVKAMKGEYLSHWPTIHASARQRAEAALITLESLRLTEEGKKP